MKKYIGLGLCLVLLASITGCAQNVSPGNTSSPVTLRFAWWGPQERQQAMKSVAEQYMVRYPNVQIEVEYGSFDGWEQRLYRELTGGNPPDIMQVDYNWVHSFGKGQNVFYDLRTLDKYLTLSDWDASLLDALTVNGQLAAVPYGKTGRMNVYSKTFFDAYGLAYPSTYEAFLAAGEAVSTENKTIDVDNRYVLTNIGKATVDYFIAQMLYNNTGLPMQTSGTVNYTVQQVASALETYGQMEASGAVPTFVQEDPIQNESNPVWVHGRSGSIREWVGAIKKYIDSYKQGGAEDELAIGPFVTMHGSDTVTIYVKPTESFAISRETQHPEIAADFIHFIFTDPQAIRTLGDTYGVSSHKVTLAQQQAEQLVTGLMLEGYQTMNTYQQVMLDPYFEDSDVHGARYKAIEAYRTGVASAEDAATLYIDLQNAQLRNLYTTAK